MGNLQIKNLRVPRPEFEVCVNDLKIDAGRVLGIVGRSGCGKSTLLNAIAGFEPLCSGEVIFGDKILSNLRPEARKVSIVFQRSALFSHLTVSENICFGLKIKKMAKSQQVELASYWLSRLQISNLANRYPNELSGGEAQRVALARSLIVDFPVLLLDEPFSALDTDLKTELRGWVKQIVKERQLATILVSHDFDDIQELADEFCKMEAGKITELSKLRI